MKGCEKGCEITVSKGDAVEYFLSVTSAVAPFGRDGGTKNAEASLLSR